MVLPDYDNIVKKQMDLGIEILEDLGFKFKGYYEVPIEIDFTTKISIWIIRAFIVLSILTLIL